MDHPRCLTSTTLLLGKSSEHSISTQSIKVNFLTGPKGATTENRVCDFFYDNNKPAVPETLSSTLCSTHGY